MTTPPRPDHQRIIRHFDQAREKAEKSNQPRLVIIMIRRGQPPVVFSGAVAEGRDNDTFQPT